MLDFDIMSWVETVGYLGLFLIIFAETGLLIGFFLPGDSLVFAAGILAAKHVFDIWVLVPLLVFTAILGYSVAYWIGRKLGHILMHGPDRFWFKKHYIHQAQTFYKKYGAVALIIGRLIPIVRTFIPLVAGMAKMPHTQYTFYNIIGGLIWGGGITLLGYFLGTMVPDAHRYLLPIIVIIVLISILPTVCHVLMKLYKRRKKV